jgi:AcrR family transcriptional regulator
MGGVTSVERRRGPRAGNPGDTRSAIAGAALAEFAERGFARATIRSIAARADVDPALIHHYFGTKAGLFEEVLALGYGPAREALSDVVAGPREHAGERMARAILTLAEDPAFRGQILAIMRTAMTEPEVAHQAGGYVQQALLPALATLALGPDPRRSVSLAMSHLVGLMLARHVLGLDALQGSVDDLVAEVGPVVQGYLDGGTR